MTFLESTTHDGRQHNEIDITSSQADPQFVTRFMLFRRPMLKIQPSHGNMSRLQIEFDSNEGTLNRAA